MRLSTSLAASALAVGASAKNYLGFNSGSTLADRSAKFKADYKAEFETSQNLEGAPGTFNAVRLYTNIQAYSEDDPIEAFEAAIETDTSILLGVWASGTDNIDKELSALSKAVDKYGDDFIDLVIGISIGSEDLYRNSVTGVANKAGVGNSPENIVNFINDFKKAFADSALGKIPVGHVDTWDVWPNATNKAVLDAIDFIGVDEYPYYESGKGNSIDNAGTLFDKAYDATIAAANGKPVWVTETGWPYTGPDWDEGVPSIKNAKTYWDEVGCRRLFNKTPTFWYNLRDSNPDNKMKFAITKNLSTKPLFDLTCPTTFDTPSKTKTASSTASATGKAKTTETASSGDSESTSFSTVAASATGTGTASGSGTETASGSGSGSGSDATATSSSSSGSTASPSSGSGSGAATLKISAAALAAAAGVLALF